MDIPFCVSRVYFLFCFLSWVFPLQPLFEVNWATVLYQGKWFHCLLLTYDTNSTTSALSHLFSALRISVDSFLPWPFSAISPRSLFMTISSVMENILWAWCEWERIQDAVTPRDNVPKELYSMAQPGLDPRSLNLVFSLVNSLAYFDAGVLVIHSALSF